MELGGRRRERISWRGQRVPGEAARYMAEAAFKEIPVEDFTAAAEAADHVGAGRTEAAIGN